MPMPSDTCSISRNCVWRASTHLQAAGRDTLSTDLCVGFASDGEPCGRQAEYWLGESEDHLGQPFCAKHAARIIEHVITLTKAHSKADRKQQTDQTRKRLDTGGKVYFARRGSTVKIGHTSGLRKRMRTLEMQAGVPFDEVRVEPGTRAKEQRYHRQFSDYRQLGEWFEMADSIREQMDTMATHK